MKKVFWGFGVIIIIVKAIRVPPLLILVASILVFIAGILLSMGFRVMSESAGVCSSTVLPSRGKFLDVFAQISFSLLALGCLCGMYAACKNWCHEERSSTTVYRPKSRPINRPINPPIEPREPRYALALVRIDD